MVAIETKPIKIGDRVKTLGKIIIFGTVDDIITFKDSLPSHIILDIKGKRHIVSSLNVVKRR